MDTQLVCTGHGKTPWGDLEHPVGWRARRVPGARLKAPHGFPYLTLKASPC